MYKIIGADGREYGPIATDVLKKWVADGRANAQTKVLLEGTTEWRTLADFPELMVSLSSAPPLTAYGSVTTATAATSEVSGPAIGLIITAAFGLFYSLGSIAWNLLLAGSGIHQPGISSDSEFFRIFSGTLGLIGAGMGFIMYGLILYGALKMQKLQSYGWAMAASILALLPCSPCCVIGLPIGIWGLVVLSKPEIKSQFH